MCTQRQTDHPRLPVKAKKIQTAETEPRAVTNLSRLYTQTQAVKYSTYLSRHFLPKHGDKTNAPNPLDYIPGSQYIYDKLVLHVCKQLVLKTSPRHWYMKGPSHWQTYLHSFCLQKVLKSQTLPFCSRCLDSGSGSPLQHLTYARSGALRSAPPIFRTAYVLLAIEYRQSIHKICGKRLKM